MEEKLFRKYIILWLSQSISGLGSSMTGFALILWAYGQSRSAMSVSLMSFCNYVPYVFLSLFAGGFIDSHKKKTIMLVSDSIAAAGSLAVLAFLFATGGLPLILLIDLASFVFAFCVLLFFITIPEQPQDKAYRFPFAGIAEGFDFLKKEKGILYIMLTMALINFCSRLTYENILSPMILARSAGDGIVLGTVNACMGLGGIAGGIIVSVKKEGRHKAVAIYVSAGIILGGYLADYVFEPFMVSGNRLAGMLGAMVGNSSGSGMAAMFLCTGICGFMMSMASCCNREIKKLN